MNIPVFQIIYASTSGNVESVCEKISDILTSHKIQTSLHRAENTDFSVIAGNELFIFATSTWEHGEINPFFNKLLSEIASNDLAGKTAAFVGLGDTRYEQILFCKGVDILRDAFLKSGGTEISTTLKINGEPYDYMNTTIKMWSDRLASLLSQQ